MKLVKNILILSCIISMILLALDILPPASNRLLTYLYLLVLMLVINR